MNVLITLPKHLLDKIVSGEKEYEMRKSQPKNMIIGNDGFFVVEKGTNDVRYWCRVDKVIELTISEAVAKQYSDALCVSPDYIINYAKVGSKVYLWKIGKRIALQDLCRESLFVSKNPQSFAYCPLSYGESF